MPLILAYPPSADLQRPWHYNAWQCNVTLAGHNLRLSDAMSRFTPTLLYISLACIPLSKPVLPPRLCFIAMLLWTERYLEVSTSTCRVACVQNQRSAAPCTSILWSQQKQKSSQDMMSTLVLGCSIYRYIRLQMDLHASWHASDINQLKPVHSESCIVGPIMQGLILAMEALLGTLSAASLLSPNAS